MSKFKYDIFISYKRGKNESNENGYKYLGLSVARMLKLSLEKEGYDVYFDCDTEDKGKSSDKAKQNADDKKALETLVAMEKSRLVLLLLTGYSFDNEDGKTVATGVFGKELEKIKGLWSANENNASSSKTRILAINIDSTFNEGKDYGKEYKWVKEVLDNSYVSPLTPKAAHDFRTNQFFNNDFHDLINKIKGRGKGELNIRPSVWSTKRMKLLLVSLALFCFVCAVFLVMFMSRCSKLEQDYNEYKSRPLVLSTGLINYLMLEHGLNTDSVQLLVEYPPSFGSIDVSWVDKDTDTNANVQCPILVVDTMPDTSNTYFKKQKSIWLQSNYHLMEFDLGKVELAVYLCTNASDTSVMNNVDVLYDDLLRRKFFGKSKTKYYVMMGMHGTGERYIDILYKKYQKLCKDYNDTNVLSKDVFRDSLVDGDFRPYHTGVWDPIVAHTSHSEKVIILENTSVQEYIDQNKQNVHVQTIYTKEYLHLRAYTLVKIKTKVNNKNREIRGDIVFTNNQKKFFDQLQSPNDQLQSPKYDILWDSDVYENGEIKPVIQRKAGW